MASLSPDTPTAQRIWEKKGFYLIAYFGPAALIAQVSASKMFEIVRGLFPKPPFG